MQTGSGTLAFAAAVVRGRLPLGSRVHGRCMGPRERFAGPVAARRPSSPTLRAVGWLCVPLVGAPHPGPVCGRATACVFNPRPLLGSRASARLSPTLLSPAGVRIMVLQVGGSHPESGDMHAAVRLLLRPLWARLLSVFSTPPTSSSGVVRGARLRGLCRVLCSVAPWRVGSPVTRGTPP